MVSFRNHLPCAGNTPADPSGYRGFFCGVAKELSEYAPRHLLKDILKMIFGFLVVGATAYLVIYWMGRL